MALSSSFNKVKLLAEDLKATDYTLTQSSLDQVCIAQVSRLPSELQLLGKRLPLFSC